MKKKKLYHKGNLDNLILESAKKIIVEDGYKSVSIRNITTNLEVSSTSLYRHFKNIDEMFDEIIYLFSEYLSKKLTDNINEKDNTLVRLEIMACNFVDFAKEDKNIFELLFLSEYSGKDLLDSKPIKFSTFELFWNLVDEACKENNLDKNSNTLFAQLWSFIFGYSILVRENSLKFDKNIIKKTLNDFLKG